MVKAAATDCPPLYATPRDPARDTLGGAVAEVAEQLGMPLMPWQRQVADVAMEVDPATGLLAYREVDLTTPRQSGKTTLELAVLVHRCRTWARSRALYAAQSRIHAHKKWEDEHVATLQTTPYADEFDLRRQRGDEAIRWYNGSLHGITAPGEKAGHSEVLDLAVVDEAWAHEDAWLEQGLSPTMITRPQPQLWVVSTAGTHRSAYLRGKVEQGRARVRAGRRSAAAYFEWSGVPGSDPADPKTWRSCMPALGHTVTEARIAAEFERLELADFCRAYLNWFPGDIPADWLIIAEADWIALADPWSETVDPVAFAADVTPERSHAAIATAGLRPDGLGHVEVVDHRPGTGGSSGGWSSSMRNGRRARWSSTTPAPLGRSSPRWRPPRSRSSGPPPSNGPPPMAGSMTPWPSGPCAMSHGRPWTPRWPAPPPVRWGMPGRGPARGCRPISRHWLPSPWHGGAMRPGPTSTTASRPSTSERATTPGSRVPRGRRLGPCNGGPAQWADGLSREAQDRTHPAHRLTKERHQPGRRYAASDRRTPPAATGRPGAFAPHETPLTPEGAPTGVWALRNHLFEQVRP